MAVVCCERTTVLFVLDAGNPEVKSLRSSSSPTSPPSSSPSVSYSDQGSSTIGSSGGNRFFLAFSIASASHCALRVTKAWQSGIWARCIDSSGLKNKQWGLGQCCFVALREGALRLDMVVTLLCPCGCRPRMTDQMSSKSSIIAYWCSTIAY